MHEKSEACSSRCFRWDPLRLLLTLLITVSVFSSLAPLLSGAIVLATISCLCQFINSRDLVTTLQPGHMFCTGVTKLDHARCIYGEENYVLYNARINCRPTIKSTPTVLGVFRQALDHNQIKLNQSPVIFITKPGHLTVVQRCHGSCSTPVLSDFSDLHHGSLYPMIRLVSCLTSYDSPVYDTC